MKKLSYIFFLFFASTCLHGQVVSIRPATALLGQTLTTTITLANSVMLSSSAPTGASDIYLQQGATIIYTNSYSSAQQYTLPYYPYFDDSLFTDFTIPIGAPLGWYDVHVLTYQTPIPWLPPVAVDNVLTNGFLVPAVNSCPVPSGLSATSITNTSAVINWTSPTVADTFRIRYQTSTSLYYYQDVAGIGGVTNTTLNNLTPGTTYFVDISTICNGAISSTYSVPILSFSTTSISVPCIRPNGISASGITNTSATILWNNFISADTFRIRYAEQYTTNYRYFNSVSPIPHSQVFSNLNPGTTYTVQISSICTGVSSGYSIPFNFTTLSTPVACVRPWGLSSSNITNISATLNWSPNVTADTFRIRYSVFGSGNNSFLNINGSGGSTATLNNLQANTLYTFQVSSICSGVSYGYSGSALFTTLNVPVACARPHTITATNITNVSALISWTNAVSADTFRIRYNEQGSFSFKYFNQPGLSGNSATLTGLYPNTTYNFVVSSICSGVSSGYCGVNSFTTTSVPVACVIPTGLTSTNITNNSADISWSQYVSADTFLIRYSVNGTTNYTWKKVPGTGGNGTTLTGLLPITTYQWQVRSVCVGNPLSSYSAPAIFGTPAKIRKPDFTDIAMTVYPNPANDKISVCLERSSDQNKNSLITIFDLSGRIVLEKEVVCIQGKNVFELDINFLSVGMYVLKFDGEKVLFVVR